MMQAAILGYGTIGSGVAEVLAKNADQIGKAAGTPITLKYVLDLRDFPGSPVEDRLVHDFSVIENDPEIGIVVETMGGLNPAYPFVKASLLAGRHVVTSNKALVAAYGTELLAIAREKDVNFFFEASVGGGIPILRPLERCLKGEKIEEISGILNGTTNFILTKMEKEGASFDTVLKEAQSLGYAERNPEADVEGYDTCRKIAILTALATEREVNYEDIYTEGITKITDTDFLYAKKLGAAIKLFGSSRISGDGVHVWVAPLLIGRENPLCMVDGVMNAVLVRGNMLGTTMYYGSGAGKLPTASAVVADMIEAAASRKNVQTGWTGDRLTVADMDTSFFRYLIRIQGDAGTFGAAAGQTFGAAEFITVDGLREFAVLTPRMEERDFKTALIALRAALAEAGSEGVLQTIRAEL